MKELACVLTCVKDALKDIAYELKSLRCSLDYIVNLMEGENDDKD